MSGSAVDAPTYTEVLTNETSHTMDSLHPFFTYTFRVAAFTVGVGPYTAPIIITLPESGEIIDDCIVCFCY